jgi:hypothetical protein
MIQGAVSRLIGWVREAQQSFVGLAHAAENIGIDATALDEVHDTFARFGVAGDAVNAMFSRMESARDSAINGNAAAIKSFEALGITLENLARMNPKQLYDAIAASNAAAGGAGDASVATEQIFGRGMKKGAMRKAFRSYGEGEWFESFAEADEDAVTATRVASTRAGLAWKGFENALGNVWGQIVQKPRVDSAGKATTEAWMAGIPIVGPGIIAGRAISGVGRKELDKDRPTTPEDEAKLEADRRAAIERTRKRREEVEAENTRHQNELNAMRNEEIEKGVRWQPAPVDSLRRRGLVAGGEAGGEIAYAMARRQVEISERIAANTERTNRLLAEKTKHEGNLARITGGADYGKEIQVDAGGVE